MALGEGSSANLEHDDKRAEHNSLLQVDADTYALAYEGGSNADGYITTFTISADGSTTLAEVESIEHDNSNGEYNSLVQVDADTYALAHSDDTGDDGFITTFTISADWDRTTITQFEQVKHDDAMTKYNSLLHVAGDTYAVSD